MPFPELERLLQTLVTLRGPDGCPWDRSQDLATASRHLADEVHEYADAAARGDVEEMKAELADLLYMVCFSWLLLSEKTEVELDELAGRGADKLIHRKPHVFGDETAATPDDAQRIWKRQKAIERQRGAERAGDESPDAGVENPDSGGDLNVADHTALKVLSPAVSPLRQALVYGTSAAETGFDWPNPEAVERKLHEEIDELKQATDAGDRDGVVDEMGDILFAAVQLARKLGVDPDAALGSTNRKFARRFREMEARTASEGRRVEDLSIDVMFEYWEDAKKNERR